MVRVPTPFEPVAFVWPLVSSSQEVLSSLVGAASFPFCVPLGSRSQKRPHWLGGFHLILFPCAPWFQVTGLMDDLIAVVKVGVAKPAQRLDALYALLLSLSIAAVDSPSGGPQIAVVPPIALTVTRGPHTVTEDAPPRPPPLHSVPVDSPSGGLMP